MKYPVITEKLKTIRAPQPQTKKSTVLHAAISFGSGAALGFFAKWLDGLALDSSVRWQRWLEALDLGNFFSDVAVWMLLALGIAVFSRSALRAAGNVFVFLAGMCAAYHLYTIRFSGFDPTSYMMIWYGITALSPLFAVLCWYARGSGAAALLLNSGIMAVFAVACFSIGFFYIGLRGFLYLLVFVGAAACLYRSPKQSLIALPLGILLAFPISPLWPFH